MKNLPFSSGFHSKYQKSKIPKERRVFILSGFLLQVFFLYLMQMLNRSMDFPLARVYWAFTDIPTMMKPYKRLLKTLSLRKEALQKLSHPGLVEIVWKGKRKIWSVSWAAEESRRTDETSQSERRVGQANKRCYIGVWERDTVSKEGYWGYRDKYLRR